MNRVVEVLVGLIIVPCFLLTFCIASRQLLLCEISEKLHIRKPHVKMCSLGDWLFVSYYRTKAGKKQIRLRTFYHYICVLVLAAICSIFILLAAMFGLQNYDIFSLAFAIIFIILNSLNIASLLILKKKYHCP